MAKTLTKPSARRALTTARAKSAAKARPAKPVAKSAVKAAPKSSARTVTKAAPAKPAAKAALTKASLAKKTATRSSGAKLPPLKVQPKKSAPAKASAVKPKAAAAEASPASEAEIMGAVSGKLSGRAGAAGFSWLNTAKAEAPAAETPAAPPVEETPAPAEGAANSVILMEEVPPVFYEEVGAVVVEAVETPADATPEETAPAAADDAAGAPSAEAEAAEAVVEIVTVESNVETAAPVPVAGSVPETTPPPGTGSDEARAQAFKTAASQLGWSLGLQGLVFLAFCMLAKGGIPLAGLAHFLANAIPLFAMLLIAGAFMTHSATQVVLDRLEGENHALTMQRKLAHLPAQIILGVLMVVWFFIGITVWFLG